MQGSVPGCFECAGVAHHQHHVVPRVHGGTKTVWLCSPCHGLAHSHNMPLPELIKAGIAKARAKNGGKWGVDRTLPYEKILELHAQGYSKADIARKLKLNYGSVHKIFWRKKPKK